MTSRTTVGWSLITAGVVTLLLMYLPGESVPWGIGPLVTGIAVFMTELLCIFDS
jgi:hypothetical protein